MTRADTSVENHDLIAERRSPRSLDATATIEDQDLLAMLEAARWAPSSNNLQPWKFIAGKRGDEIFETLLNCLVPFNQSWSSRASLFIAVGGTPTQADGKEIPTFMYDCGLSVSQLTIEAHHRGYVVHQMGGFDRVKAAPLFEGAVPIVIMAIGKQAPAEQLEGPAYDREVAPRSRKELSEIVLKGLPTKN
jgi:nitroreductase